MFLKALIESFQNQVSLLDLEQVVNRRCGRFTIFLCTARRYRSTVSRREEPGVARQTRTRGAIPRNIALRIRISMKG